MFTTEDIKKALKIKGYTEYEINHTINLIEEISKQIFDYSKIDNIEFDGIDHSDAPDYSDDYIVSANYDGIPMTEEEVKELNKKMELQTAIEILEYHQEWRLGKRKDMIHDPKKLTEALNIVIKEVKKLRIGAVIGSFNMQDLMLYYQDKEDLDFTSKVVDVLKYMVNDR